MKGNNRFTAEEIRWLLENYPNKTNAELCQHLKCCKNTAQKYVLLHGGKLGKSEELTKKIIKRAVCARLADMEVNPEKYEFLKGGKIGNKHRFSKGRNSFYGKSEEEKEKQRNNISASLKRVYKEERRRVLYGLEQRTKLRVTKQDSPTQQIRCRLRRCGYIIAKGAFDCYYNEQTKRSEKRENWAIKHGYRFRPINGL